MSGMLFMGGMGPATPQPDASGAVSRIRSQTTTMKREVEELKHQVARLSLLNQALWELVRVQLHLSDHELERMAREVDLRDGVEDGEISNIAVKCPRCGRVSNSKHYKCLYCGLEFQKPIMG